MDLTVRCTCGTVQGTLHNVAPSTVNVTVCDCKWCQWYATALGRDEEMLDQHGGSTVIMASPARLTFSAGQDQVVCGRMTSKGPMRWYAGCCKTPIANTIRATIPFMAVHPICIEEDVIPNTIGPARARINSKLTGAEARELRATNLPQLMMLSRLAGMLGVWWLQGAHNKMPFPDVEPHRLQRPEA